MKLPSIQQVVQDSRRTFFRFPFVLTDATIGTVAALVLIDHEGPPAASVLFNILAAAILGIPLLTGVALVSEKKKWRRPLAVTAQAAGLLLLVAYAFSVPSDIAGAPNIHLLRLLMLAASLLFFVAVAPFAGKLEQNGFWQYNKALLLRFLTALLYSVVLYAGLAIALVALDRLFGLNVPAKWYFQLWICISGLFMTCLFLAGVPDDLERLDASTEYPKGIRIFAQYILFPLVIVYLLILYAYLGKILIAWAWPIGWVSGLILGFSTAGILLLLLLYPLHDRVENLWMKIFSLWFYVALIPLVVMLLLAVWKRMSEYGTTEGRYLAAGLGVWLALMVIYFLIGKTKNIKVIPGSLCLFSLLVSFGPWSMFGVSERSQTGRLRNLLERNSILVDGTVRKAPGTVPFEDTKQISSIISYLHNIHGYDGIQPWFHESLRQDSAGPGLAMKDPALVGKLMGVEYVNVWLGAREGNIMLNADRDAAIEIEGYDRMVRAQHIRAEQLTRNFPAEEIRIRIDPAFDTLTFIAAPNGKEIDSVQIDLRRLVDRLLHDYENSDASNIPPERMSATNSNQGMKVKVYLRQIQIRRHEGKVEPIACDVELFYTLR